MFLACGLLAAARPSMANPASQPSLRETLDRAAGMIAPEVRQALADKPSPWLIKAHDVGVPTDMHKDIPWHLLDKEKDPRFNLPTRGQIGVFNPNADIHWTFSLSVDDGELQDRPVRRYTDHLVNLAAQRVDMGAVQADMLFLPVASDTLIAVIEFHNTGNKRHAIVVRAAITKPAGDDKPAVQEPAAAWNGSTGRYGYGITVTSGQRVSSEHPLRGSGKSHRHEEWDAKLANMVGSLLCTTAATHALDADSDTYRLEAEAGERNTLILALNLHRYAAQRLETRNQIELYPAETDQQALAYAWTAVDRALNVDWPALVAESYRWYERMPRIVLPEASWAADFYCTLELPRGNTWSAQGVLRQPWYTFCRVNGHEPYGWWSYGMHAHEHLSTWVTNLTEPGLSQAYLRGHLQVQRSDGYIQYGVNPSGKNFHEPLATAPLLAAESWAAYTWSHDRTFLAEAYAATGSFVRWWRSPARTRTVASSPSSDRTSRTSIPALQHWLDFVETVRDDKDLATWTATSGAQHQEALDLNCYLLNEERTLVRMAHELGHDDEASGWQADADARTAAMRAHLWHAEDGVYYGRDLADGRWARVMDISTFFPLWSHLATSKQADSIVHLLHDPTAFGTDYPVATLAVRHMPDKLRGQYHWRGANWVEMTWPVIQGLRDYGHYDEAARIAEANCRMVFRTLEQTGHFREFYNSLTGEPSDLTDYIWTSMPAIMMVETFFGLRPTGDGLEILPALPAGWNEIRMENLHIRHSVISLHVRRAVSADEVAAIVNGRPVPMLAGRGVAIRWTDLADHASVQIAIP